MCVTKSAVRALILIPLWGLLVSASADEREFALSASSDAALLRSEGSRWGGGATLELSYGLSDAVALRATGSLTAHEGSTLAYQTCLGLGFALDILRVVPFVDFSFGLLGRRAEGSWSNDFGVTVGLGADYLVSRRLTLGGIARFGASLTSNRETPLLFYVGPRITFRFGG